MEYLIEIVEKNILERCCCQLLERTLAFNLSYRTLLYPNALKTYRRLTFIYKSHLPFSLSKEQTNDRSVTTDNPEEESFQNLAYLVRKVKDGYYTANSK